MTFKCLENCADCCGLVGFEKELVEKHRDKISNGLKFQEIDDRIFFEILPCPFLDENKKCKIYEDRPEVCRVYGVDERLPCIYLKPNGRKRSEASRKRIERKVGHQIDAVVERGRQNT